MINMKKVKDKPYYEHSVRMCAETLAYYTKKAKALGIPLKSYISVLLEIKLNEFISLRTIKNFKDIDKTYDKTKN